MLPAIQGLFAIPSSITLCADEETASFENIPLSTQGAERQRKDVLWH